MSYSPISSCRTNNRQRYLGSHYLEHPPLRRSQVLASLPIQAHSPGNQPIPSRRTPRARSDPGSHRLLHRRPGSGRRSPSHLQHRQEHQPARGKLHLRRCSWLRSPPRSIPEDIELDLPLRHDRVGEHHFLLRRHLHTDRPEPHTSLHQRSIWRGCQDPRRSWRRRGHPLRKFPSPYLQSQFANSSRSRTTNTFSLPSATSPPSKSPTSTPKTAPLSPPTRSSHGPSTPPPVSSRTLSAHQLAA